VTAERTIRSFKAEVIAAGGTQWISGKLRFATEIEAQRYLLEWACSVPVRNTRITATSDPVTEGL
jgi:hypothetical protein